jgi:predicted RNA-binding protein with PIN domain
MSPVAGAQSTVTIVDGYNVIHRAQRFRESLAGSGMDAARRALLAYCAEWMARRRDVGLFLIVFDSGPSVDGSQEGVAAGVRTIHTRHGESADTRIHSLLLEWQSAARCAVVSDDAEVARRSRRAGAADVMSVQAFAGVIRPADRQADGVAEGMKNGLTPIQEKNITDELRRLWGG